MLRKILIKSLWIWDLCPAVARRPVREREKRWNGRGGGGSVERIGVGKRWRERERLNGCLVIVLTHTYDWLPTAQDGTESTPPSHLWTCSSRAAPDGSHFICLHQGVTVGQTLDSGQVLVFPLADKAKAKKQECLSHPVTPEHSLFWYVKPNSELLSFQTYPLTSK